jgi:hypothetical protein
VLFPGGNTESRRNSALPSCPRTQKKAEAFPEKLIAVTKEQMISNFIIGTESTLNRMTSAGASLLLKGKVRKRKK